MLLEQESQLLEQRLATYLAARTGRVSPVQVLRRLSTGWESDIDVVSVPGLHDGMDLVVLRSYFGASAGATVLAEARALELLASLGYPVPEVLLVEPSAVPLGRPFLLMQYIAGDTLGVRMRSTDPALRRAAVARLVSLFAQLHRLPWSRSEMAQALPRYTLRGALDGLAAYAQRFPSAAFDACLGWLHSNVERVREMPLAVIHFDFHAQNVLVDGEDRAWVIDWTQCQITDPRLDLAWTMTLVGSEQGVQAAMAVRDGYAEATRQLGRDLPLEDLGYFEAAAAARRVLSVLISLAHGADALGMRPGAEQTMTAYLPMIANVYRRWLQLTGVGLAEAEERLAGYL